MYVLFALLIVSSCGSKEEKFSSPKALFVDYISAYTAGIVSNQSAIKIMLSKPIEGIIPGSEVSNDFFSFEPKIDGSVFWEDNRTLVFKPKTSLPSGSKYKVSFAVAKLFETDADKSNFKFEFETVPQNFDVEITGFAPYDPGDLTKVKISGVVITADYASQEAVEKIILAEQKGKNLKISWIHNSVDNRHQFTIENVARTEDEETVDIEWDGEPLNIEKEGETTFKVPSLNDFKVVSVNIVREGDNYISLRFSDPISANQNLKGLISLKGLSKTPTLLAELNEVKIYTAENLQGKIDILVSQGIKNSSGYSLKEDYETSLLFEQTNPDLRITAKSGTIIPGSQGLVLPFEAVNLGAVEVQIVQIFEDNILQYLQVNRMGDQRELHRVGKPVARKTISLKAMGVTNLGTWNRFTLDLSDIFKAQPGAMYQVNLKFRKKHSLYFCGDANNNDLQGIEDEEEDWGPEESSNWDYYDDYYYYSWEDRNNPCSEGYYARQRAKSKILFASNIGLMAKHSDGGKMHIFSTEVTSTKPLGDVAIEVYDFQQQKIGEGKTDGKGKVVIDHTGKPFAIIAKKDNQIGYLKVDDGSSLSLSNFDVGGTQVKKGIKGFVYGERGVWRPADTLHLSFILEDGENRLPENYPVILELFDPQGKLYTRKIASSPSGKIYYFPVTTSSEAPTGNWLAKVKAGGSEFQKQIKIETVKPNRLKIDLDFGTEKLTYLDRDMSGDLNVRWLHGATAGNLKADFEVMLVPTTTKFDGYTNVTFDDPSKEFFVESEQIFEGRLNSEGYAKMNFRLSTDDEPPGALNAIFKGKVFEEGGDFSIDKVIIPFYPYRSFVGLTAPEGDRRGMLVTDKDHAVRVVSVDAYGKPVSKDKVKVELYKLRWRWWWDNSSDNISNYIGRESRSPIDEKYVSTSNGEGKYTFNIKYPEWGRYYLKVTDPESGHSAGQVIYADWPGWAGKSKRGDIGGTSMLSFETDKAEYNTGEKAKITFPSSAGGRALVSLETGSEVLQTYWVDTEDELTSLEFETTASMAPTVYAHISLLQPHSQTANDLPIRMYGIQPIKVLDANSMLKPLISIDKELRPEQEFTVKVKEEKGRKMTYTIAIVDDGLLDLTKFKTPDPWNKFFSREALGVKTWDVYDDVMGAYAGHLERLLAVGGDDEIGAKDDNKANRFKPVVLFKGPFKLEAGREATHKFKMHQYVGSVRTMVVAANDNAYGHAEATTPVRQPLMVLATLPRVAGPGEKIRLPVNVFVMNDKIKSIDLQVETSGKLKLEGASTKTLTNNGKDQLVEFNLISSEALGIGKVKVTAKGGGITATYDVELDVRPSNPMMSSISGEILSGDASWSENYKPYGITGTNDAVLEISTMPSLNLEQRLQYLIRYPHGCIEQTTSSVFPQLYLTDLTELPSDKKESIERNIKEGINRLKLFQRISGGFSYWPGNQDENSWGTNYAGHFLISAKNKGYVVPEAMVNSWKTFQKERANAWPLESNPNRHEQLTQSYRLLTLALAKDPELGAMNRMKERQDLGSLAKWQLALAYAVAGYKSEAAQMLEGLTSEVKDYKTPGMTYGSYERDKAIILQTLVQLDRNEEAFQVVKEIAEAMGDKNKWMSTQTTAYCLLAVADYAKTYRVGESANVSVSIDGKQESLNKNSFITQLYLVNAEKSHQLNIKNNGQSPVYVRLIRRGIPLGGNEEEVESNIRMSVVYKTLDDQPLDVKNLKQGTDFKAEVTLHNTGLLGDYDELALTQIFPSGWEIINTRLDDTQAYYKQDAPEYQDIRDDRVYTYFDLKSNERKVFSILLNASYIGEYYMPGTAVEAMYDNKVRATKAGSVVKVLK